MFLQGELKRLEKLVDPAMSADDVLDENDLALLSNRIQPERIRDSLFIPAHNRKKKTIRLIKVYHTAFDLGDFVKKLTNCLVPEYEIRISLSFFMMHASTPSHVLAIPARIVNPKFRIIRDQEDKQNLVTFLKEFSYVELLNETFTMRNTTNPFAESGYRPEKLVSATFWITKYPST